MSRALFVVAVMACCGAAVIVLAGAPGRTLSRQRRYLTFPEGATFNVRTRRKRALFYVKIP